MKFAHVLKSVALASALVAGSSFAASITVTSSGSSAGAPAAFQNYKLGTSTGTLNLSNDSDPNGSSVVGAFSLINTSLTAAISAAAPGTAVFGTDANANATAAAVAPINSVVYDSTTGNVTDVFSNGGLNLSAIATGASKGGTITITNIHANLATSTLFADVIGTPTYAGGVAFTHSQEAVFTYSSLVGSTAVPTIPVGGSATVSDQLIGLAATSGFKTDLTNAMGLKGIGLSTLNALTNYGELDSSITFTNAVPEPSTYAMVGLGLAVTGFVARRRAR